MTKTKEIEYPDAQCGYVTMYNYKEPFMPFKDPVSREGYGYEGVLVFDGETDKVQCHLCGNWYHALGNHIQKEHALTASEYKLRVGLSQSTALIGEQYRAKLIANGKERFKNLKPGTFTRSDEFKKKISETLKNRTRQLENMTGTCPYQLLDRLQKKADELGRCPTTREITFMGSLERVYGNFRNACDMIGLKPLEPSQTLTRKKSGYTKEWCINTFRPYWIKEKKFPRYVDVMRMFGKQGENIWHQYSKIEKEVQNEILFGEKVFQKIRIRISYSKAELLDILRDFAKVHGRNASVSDCKRGFLPHYSRYHYHFGSLKNAIEQL